MMKVSKVVSRRRVVVDEGIFRRRERGVYISDRGRSAGNDNDLTAFIVRLLGCLPFGWQ